MLKLIAGVMLVMWISLDPVYNTAIVVGLSTLSFVYTNSNSDSSENF